MRISRLIRRLLFGPDKPSEQKFETIPEFFSALPALYDPSWACPALRDPDRKRTGPAYMMWVFSGTEPQTWTISMTSDHCVVEQCGITDPDVRIEMPSDTWMKILRGEMSRAIAYRNGDIIVTGDFFLYNNLGFLFGKQPKP